MDVVRPARPADAEPIAIVHRVTWRLAYRGLLPAAYLRRLRHEPLVARWRDVIAGRGRRDRVWVAERDGGIVGFAESGASDARDLEPGFAGEVYMLYVHPAHQGQGLGRRLLDAALADLEERGFFWAVIGVLERNAPARRFYERAGFVADGARWVDHTGGGQHVVVRYARPLNPLVPDP
ncbi:MAG: N-acetyltransferase [Deltaproteobacteria bacterium]|nr:MAG: N-acetyltransferase [Deltaproteobacteria bacterium]